MARPLITDEIWEQIEPLLPEAPQYLKGGRPRVSDRAVLTGIVFVFKTGLVWQALPHEMGCGCGMTCFRRMREWQQAGVWDQICAILINNIEGADQIDWSRAGISDPLEFTASVSDVDCFEQSN